jgi:Arc/MetJ-type ribon-helix-helix transcriptional regulator
MATEMVNIKLESKFLKEIDSLVEKNNYQSRTEFIRNALRKGVDEAKLREAMIEIGKLKGSAKREVQTTDEELHEIRERVFQEMGRKFKSSGSK